MTRAAHMIEFAVCTRTNGMEHRAFGMHVGVSLVPTYTLSYMLIFTKQFLCAFDCHQCGVQARPATSRVNTALLGQRQQQIIADAMIEIFLSCSIARHG